MPQLKWSEHELIDGFGVLPETDEFFRSQTFQRAQDGLCFVLSVYEDESLINFSVSSASGGESFLDLFFVVRDSIRLINEKDLTALDFLDCVFVDCHLWNMLPEERIKVFDKNIIQTNTNLRLQTYPRFRFRSE